MISFNEHVELTDALIYYLNRAYISKANTVIRENADAVSGIIIKIPEHAIVYEITNVKYWVKIIYIHPTNKKYFVGWASKRSVRKMYPSRLSTCSVVK